VTWTAQRPDELSFNQGDVITVVAKGVNSGFWEGVMGTRRGQFPNCFVTSNANPNRPPTFCNKAMAMHEYAPHTDAEMRLRKHDVVTLVGRGASPGWWRGVNESEKKRVAAAGAGGAAAAAAEAVRLLPSNFMTCNIVQSLFAFEGRQHCELTIAVGDVILLHRRWNDGWWEGSLPVAAGAPVAQVGGVAAGGMRRGIFPSNYSAPNVSSLSPPLFCARCRAVFPPGSLECKDCARNEEIVRTMHQTLDDATEGVLPTPDTSAVALELDADGNPVAPPKLEVDLFMHIDLDPSKGRGALLAASDVKDTSVRPRLATSEAASHSANTSRVSDTQ
jgi:hypothetical protein